MASSIASRKNLGDVNSLADLEKHTAIEKIGGILCHICNSIIGNKKDYDSHYTQHNTGAPDIIYACVVCKQQLYTYPNFRSHCYLSHVAKNKLKCNYCNRHFSQQSVLNSHVSAIHEYKSISSSDQFTSNCDIKKHKQTILKDETHDDDHGYFPHDETNTPNTLKQTAIDKIGGIFCHICNSIFGNKKDYDTHYAQHNTGSAEIVYTCVKCKKQISSYPSFRGHCYLNHVVKNKFPCKHCSKQFSKLCALTSHIGAVHDHKCNSCNDKFTSKRDLEIHKNIIHTTVKGKNEPPYDCLRCGCVIKTVDACESHIEDHCEMLYPCPICKDVLPDKLAAIQHLTKHFQEKLPNDFSAEPSYGVDSSIDILGGIRCCYCDLLCRNRAEIELHLKDEHSQLPFIYTCNVCHKQNDKYELFGKHCYDHFARGKFQCDQCPKTFARLSLLVIHTEAFHTDCLPDKPFGCERCGHGYMTSLRLQEHMRIVHEEEASRSRCMKPGCSAIFDKPRDLIQHLKDHNPMLDNWCKQCGLQFTTLSSAKKHLDVHRHTQYSCPICKRTYREKYMMVKHVPSHFEAVLHICKTCGKAYNARCRLIHHMKSHSETRSYKCTFCSKSFMKPHELEQHLNIHTGRKPFSCTVCSKVFANYPNWLKHQARVHSVVKGKAKKMTAAVVPKVNSSPTKAESGIESGGSELSDVYTFVEPEDGFDDWAMENYNDDVREVNTNQDLVARESVSIRDSVNAAIETIDSLDDEDLDWIASEIEESSLKLPHDSNSEFIASNAQESMDDANDIRAIVEHIDAMSAGMEVNNVESTDSVNKLAGGDPGIIQYADMMPVDNAVFDNISEAMQATVPEVPYPSGGLPEYGPDFTSESLISLDDHVMPHIDPLLTIKAENNSKMYVPNLNNYNFASVTAPIECAAQTCWTPPVITKPYKYEENNDVNNMYIIY